MNIEDLRAYCLAKSAVTEELPFGPDTLVFKVGGKIFLLVGLEQVGELRFNVKCDPEIAVQLRLHYPDTVIPGYHMNKKHWNTVYCDRQLSDERLRSCIDDSYMLVYHSLSKSIKDTIQVLQ